MSNLLKYPALNAKMKGMYVKNLNKDEMDELIRQNNLKETITFLKAKFNALENINENMSRRNLEQELNNLFINDILKLYKYLDKKEKDVFKQFLLKYKISCVKNVFRNITTNKEVSISLKNIDNWTTKVFPSIKGINNISEEIEFLDIIKDEEYYSIFQEYEETIEDAPLEEIEVKLDKYYFVEIFNLAKKVNKELEDMIGKEIDLLNIIWIYRAKMFFHYDEEQIEDILIPIHYKLSKKMKSALYSVSSFDEMKIILNQTIYKNVFKNQETLEKDRYQYLYKIYKKNFRTKLFNICTLFCYINLIDIEIKNMINVIEGIRYNIDRKQIQMNIIV